jgi:type II secretory pathway pseudopilin PulG
MSRHRQAGLILPALLIVLLFGALAFAVARYQQTMSVQTRQHLNTVRALANARTLLRNFAQAFHLTHADQSVGYLPCPDKDNDGSSDPPCGNSGELAIGRFPYRTLGTLPIRDGHGECLWYAVAGNFKDNPKKSDSFNWDTPGQFIVRTADGRNLHPVTRPTDYAAALVIAPGAPLAGQNRAPPGSSCNGAADAATALPAFIEGSYPITSDIPWVATQGEPGSNTNNDQIAWLTAGDIFGPQLQRRNDFKKMIDGMLDHIEASAVVASVIKPPDDSTLIGSISEGRIPVVTATELNHRWREQFRFLRCDASSGCMTLGDSSGLSTPCSAILLFAGAALGTQNRSLSTSDDNYFEGNVAALADPEHTLFFGSSHYVVGAASQDLIRCLP